MVVGRTVTVTTTSALLTSGFGVEGEYRLLIRSTGQIWLGDSTVAVNDGWTLNTGQIDLTVQAGDEVYAIAGGNTNVDLLVLSV